MCIRDRHTGAAPTHLLRSVRDEDRARVHARAHLTPRPLRENKISVVFSPSNTQSATRYDVARRDTAIAKGTNTKKNRSEKEEGVTRAVHGRSRLTIDPRIPTMPGRKTAVFADQAYIAYIKRDVPGGVGRIERKS